MEGVLNQESAKLAAELQATIARLDASAKEITRLRRTAERVQQTARLLEDIDQALGSHTTENTHALDEVAKLCVPLLGDACVIQLAEPTNSLHVELGTHRTQDTLAPIGRMDVPITCATEILGTMICYALEAHRDFGPDERHVAQQVALRIARAVEHARVLYECESAVHTKSEFLARMSHELRTPLNAISGYTDLLQLGVADAEQQRLYQDRIKAATLQLLSLIEEILAFARLEAGKEELQTDRLDATEIAHEAARMAELATSLKGLAFERRIPPGPLIFVSDRLKVLQILMNLLSNAVKFTHEGRIVLELQPRARHMTFLVRDTGAGISANALEDIFEPFWQAEAATTRTTGGTGLGLSVARKLTQALGGALHVTSVLGSGSTFALRLPRTVPGARKRAGAKPPH
jgi:signal transduction histidine kinase